MTPTDIDRVFGRSRLRMVTGEHVEVFREESQPGERRRYTKRFLATPAGDFSEWTEREWRILARLVGHGIRPVPDVVQFDRGAPGRPALVQTYDAGITVDHWATLLPLKRDGRVLRNVFEDCAHWWALARHCLIALDAIHELQLVHLDLKADNVCIPVGAANFDPSVAEQPLFPRFEEIALIDFAFSLVSGESLESPLPIAHQAEYVYQSPRLLQALEAGRHGDLRPTQRLDWRCDLFSLAAMLWRYLPEPEAAKAGMWTARRHAKARALVRRIMEAHDAELPAQRPHAALIEFASERLADAELAASLQRGWTLALDHPVAIDDSPTPVTQIAPVPVAAAALAAAEREPMREAEPETVRAAGPETVRAAKPETVRAAVPDTVLAAVSGPMRAAMSGSMRAAVPADMPSCEPVLASLRAAARAAVTPFVTPQTRVEAPPDWPAAAIAIDHSDIEDRHAVLRQRRVERSWHVGWAAGLAVVTVGALGVLLWGPTRLAGWQSADAGAAPGSAALAPALAPAMAPAIAPALAEARRPTAAPPVEAPVLAEIAIAPAALPERPDRPLPTPAQIVPDAQRAAPGMGAGASPPPAAAGMPAAPAATDAKPRPAPPAQTATAAVPAPSAKRAASALPTAPAKPAKPTAFATAVPTARPATAPPMDANPRALARARQAVPVNGRDGKASPAPAPALQAKAAPRPAPRPFGDGALQPRPGTAPLAARAAPASAPTAQAPPPIATARSALPAQRGPEAFPAVAPMGEASPHPPRGAAAREPEPVAIAALPRTPAPTSAGPFAEARQVAPASLDFAARSGELMSLHVPRLAQRAERQVSRVLFIAGRAEPASLDDEIAEAAGALARTPADPLGGMVLAPQDGRLLNEAGQAELLQRGRAAEALRLQSMAFGANPLDAEVAGNLAYVLLRQRPAQVEAARQLAMHALTLADARGPQARIRDWTTLAIASALAGRERDARNAWLVTLALAPNPGRQCKAAVDAYSAWGDRLRQPVEAMLQRASASGRSAQSVFCEWPPHWTTSAAGR